MNWVNFNEERVDLFFQYDGRHWYHDRNQYVLDNELNVAMFRSVKGHAEMRIVEPF